MRRSKQVSVYVALAVFFAGGFLSGGFAARYYYFDYAQTIATEALNIVLEVRRMCKPGDSVPETKKQLTKS